jgi:hypothetical protein
MRKLLGWVGGDVVENAKEHFVEPHRERERAERERAMQIAEQAAALLFAIFIFMGYTPQKYAKTICMSIVDLVYRRYTLVNV